MNYGAYGEGPKPVWVQSKRNYADPSLWVETEYPNVWKCTELLTNVGVIGFDHDLFCSSDETYNEKYGIIRNYNTDGFMGLQSMYKDLQFFSDLREAGLTSPAPLYLYSTEGNPGSRFKSIEIGERVNILGGEPQNCRVDNISFKFTGAHAIGVYNVNIAIGVLSSITLPIATEVLLSSRPRMFILLIMLYAIRDTAGDRSAKTERSARKAIAVILCPTILTNLPNTTFSIAVQDNF